MNEFTNPNLAPVYAEIFLLVAASAILLIDMFLPAAKRNITYYLSLLALGFVVREMQAVKVKARTRQAPHIRTRRLRQDPRTPRTAL